MATRRHRPIHPGEILAAEFLEALEVSQYRLAQDISVPPRRINEIVHGNRAISADSAMRLAAISVRPSASGSICSPALTLRCSETSWGRVSRRKFESSSALADVELK